tara:strand:- start:182 stop:433 length:252 start_codon:yes stop_codon:yes gene_type:complete
MSADDAWKTNFEGHKNGGTNGWGEYKRLVIHELESTNIRLDRLDKRLAKIEQRITILQTKAATYAAGIAIIISGGVSFLLKVL